MPRARTTSQGSGLLAAVGRTAVLAVLAVLLTGLVVPAPAQGAGAVAPEPAGVPGAPADGTAPAVPPEPAAVQRGPAGATSPASPPAPARLDGAVTPRRYGLPTVLAVVLLLGVASLQLRLLLAEPAARPVGPSAAPRPAAERRHGVGSPRW